MLEIRVGDGVVQALQDDAIVTVQRFDVQTQNLDVVLAQVDLAVDALRDCAREVARAHWSYHRVKARWPYTEPTP